MHPETTAPESTLLQAYTIFHVAISLLAILSGFVVLFGMLANKRLDGRTKFFLITTVLTSVTGFFFPFHGLTPGIVVGVISLVVLALAIFARYPRRLARRLVQNLRHHRRHRSLFECFRFDRPVLHENTRAEIPRPNADRTAFQNVSTRRSRVVHPPGHPRRPSLPSEHSSATRCRRKLTFR